MIVWIPRGTRPTSEKMALVLSELQAATAVTRERRMGHWIGMHSHELRRIAGGRYAQTIRECVNAGYIEVNDRYSVGRFSKSYRLTRQYRNHQTDPFLIRKCCGTSGLNSIRLAESDRTGQRLAGHFKDVSIPANVRFSNWDAYCVDRMREERWYATRCLYGRFHTTFTGMSRRVRRRLVISGEKVDETDVKNCQPLILGLSVKNEIQSSFTCANGQNVPSLGSTGPKGARQNTKTATTNQTTIKSSACSSSHQVIHNQHQNHGNNPLTICCIPVDLIRYLDLCSQGLVYETILEFFKEFTLWDFIPPRFRHRFGGNRPINRNDIKRQFLILLFSNTEMMKQLKIFHEFERHFPSVAQYLCSAKTTQYQDVARNCQRIESKTMIDGVAAKLSSRFPVITIHDSIISSRSRVDEVEACIREHFEQLGVAVELSQK